MSELSDSAGEEGFGDLYSPVWGRFGFPVFHQNERLGPKQRKCSTGGARRDVNRDDLPKWTEDDKGGKICPHCGRVFSLGTNTLHVCRLT